MCFYLFLHQGTIDFLIPPPLWEDPVSRCLCLGEVWGISNKKGFEIPWFLGQLRFFLTFYCGDSPYGKVRRDAGHMTHITYRFYGFVSKRHGLLVHFGWKLGLPKKNWRHAMRFCFQHSLLISQLILEKKKGKTPHFRWILKMMDLGKHSKGIRNSTLTTPPIQAIFLKCVRFKKDMVRFQDLRWLKVWGSCIFGF